MTLKLDIILKTGIGNFEKANIKKWK